MAVEHEGDKVVSAVEDVTDVEGAISAQSAVEEMANTVTSSAVVEAVDEEVLELEDNYSTSQTDMADGLLAAAVLLEAAPVQGVSSSHLFTPTHLSKRSLLALIGSVINLAI